MSRSKLFVLITAMSIFVILGISGGLLNIAWTYMKDDFSVSGGQLGVLLLFATTGSLIAAMASGTFIGRYGIGRVALAAMMVAALGLLGIGLSPTWFILLGIILFMFMGRGMLDASMNSFVSENYGTTSMNWLHASWGLGLTIAPSIMTFILLNLEMSWRMGYFLMASVATLLGLLIFFTLSHWRLQTSDQSEVEKPKIARASAQEALMQPAVLGTVLLFFLYGGIEIGAGQLVNTLFVEGRDIPQDQAALWLSMYWGSFTVGRMLLGVIALRLSDTVLLRGGFTLAVLGALMLSLAQIPFLNMLALVFIGFGLSGIFPILISQTPQRVGLRFSAQSIGFQVGFAGLGGAIISGIIGYLGDAFTLEMIAYGILGIALITTMVYLLLARFYPVTQSTVSES